jgi:integrase
MGIKVTVRKRPMSRNRQTVYLDYYPPIKRPDMGKNTRREFINRFVFSDIEYSESNGFTENGNPKKSYRIVLDNSNQPKKLKLTADQKEHNKDVLSFAEQLRRRRESEINKPEIYSTHEKEIFEMNERMSKNFVTYFKKLADSRQTSNHDNWISAFHYLQSFTKGTILFRNLDEEFCNNFRNYLLTTKSNRSDKTTLSQNSALSYFNKFKASLKQAYREKYLRFDLNQMIPCIRPIETRRNFLTIEELNLLVETKCSNPILKNAALFSALTGLRFSDIAKLVWGEIIHIDGNGYFLQFVQQKTGGVETLPISVEAYSLLGKSKSAEIKVFEGLNDRDRYYYFPLWASKAGITKDVTFHCLRHTYATLQLSAGTDIYTVSKMLGHRELKTTQVYAKVMDKTKRDATTRIQLNLPLS